MHQLHKDPERILNRGELAPSTPKLDMTPFELSRYLDYCSELLSFTGIIAGYYAQNSSDAVLVDAVSDIEGLTNGISRKIWQKLMILDLLGAGGGRSLSHSPGQILKTPFQAHDPVTDDVDRYFS